MNFFSKLKTLIKVVKTYKNWWKWLCFHFNFCNNDPTIVLKTRNPKCKILIKNDGEGWMMSDEIWRENIYTKYRSIKEGDNILDIGANVGLFSVFASANKKVKVYSYEPMKEAFSFLKKNISNNKLSNKIFAHNSGLSLRSGEFILYKTDGKFGSSSLFKENLVVFKNKKEVPIKNNNIEEEKINIVEAKNIWDNEEYFNFVKMDCEGAEYDILKSLNESVKKIEHFAIEYHNGCEWIKNFFKKNNFELNEIIPSKNPRFGIIYFTNKNFKK